MIKTDSIARCGIETAMLPQVHCPIEASSQFVDYEARRHRQIAETARMCHRKFRLLLSALAPTPQGGGHPPHHADHRRDL